MKTDDIPLTDNDGTEDYPSFPCRSRFRKLLLSVQEESNQFFFTSYTFQALNEYTTAKKKFSKRAFLDIFKHILNSYSYNFMAQSYPKISLFFCDRF